MPNILKLTVENSDEVLNSGAYGAGAVIRLQTSATQAGAFADVAGVGSTPTLAIVSGTRIYTGYDPAGIASSWYRTRYENVGATRVSDWTTAFQAGDETAGLLCSLYDVKQRMGDTSTNVDDEQILDLIREVSDDIEDYVGKWLAPRPVDPASTATILFDVLSRGTQLVLTSGGREVGIRTVTAISTATTSQPETGGTYTAATLADVLIRPRPTDAVPGSRLIFTNTSGTYFSAGYNVVSVTGSFGPASVAPRVQGVAIAAVIRRYLGKSNAEPSYVVGPEGGIRLLADISPGMRATLDRLRTLHT